MCSWSCPRGGGKACVTSCLLSALKVHTPTPDPPRGHDHGHPQGRVRDGAPKGAGFKSGTRTPGICSQSCPSFRLKSSITSSTGTDFVTVIPNKCPSVQERPFMLLKVIWTWTSGVCREDFPLFEQSSESDCLDSHLRLSASSCCWSPRPSTPVCVLVQVSRWW